MQIVPPDSGYLACGMTGSGRLADTPAIVEAVLGVLHHRNDLAGETVLVTAGGTREALDPVRFLGNRSSGKMGYALAEAAERRGARVILVTAPTALRPPANVEVIPVITTEEMRAAVLGRMDQASIVIKAAAVADYRPLQAGRAEVEALGPAHHRPRTHRRHPRRSRRPPPRRASSSSASPPKPRIAVAHARDKLLRKGADAIVLNDVSREGIGFDSDRNAVTFLTRIHRPRTPRDGQARPRRPHPRRNPRPAPPAESRH